MKLVLLAVLVRRLDGNGLLDFDNRTAWLIRPLQQLKEPSPKAWRLDTRKTFGTILRVFFQLITATRTVHNLAAAFSGNKSFVWTCK